MNTSNRRRRRHLSQLSISTTTSTGTITCHNCGQTGHKRFECSFQPTQQPQHSTQHRGGYRGWRHTRGEKRDYQPSVHDDSHNSSSHNQGHSYNHNNRGRGRGNNNNNNSNRRSYILNKHARGGNSDLEYLQTKVTLMDNKTEQHISANAWPDTGSEITCINSTIGKFNINTRNLQPTDLSILTTGSTFRPLGSTTIRVSIRQYQGEFKAYVVRIRNLGVDVDLLLGRDFFNACPGSRTHPRIENRIEEGGKIFPNDQEAATIQHQHQHQYQQTSIFQQPRTGPTVLQDNTTPRCISHCRHRRRFRQVRDQDEHRPISDQISGKATHTTSSTQSRGRSSRHACQTWSFTANHL